MAYLGDPHRLGRRVAQVGFYFTKPRPLELEYWVLDSKSPFRSQVEQILGFHPEGEVFLHPSESWIGGRSRSFLPEQILSAEARDQSEDYAYFSGRLLALSTLLGLIDLHSENILIIRRGRQILPVPIDLESALWTCASGMDTLLFPSSVISAARSGLTGQFHPQAYRPRAPSKILDGFLEACFLLGDRAPQVLGEWYDHVKGHPIRVFLRSTDFYRKVMTGRIDADAAHARGPLLPEEREQIQSRDIPYFFSIAGNSRKQLFYWMNETQTAEVSELSDVLRSVVDAAHPTREKWTDPERIWRLVQVTALHLCKAYRDEGLGKPQTGQYFELLWPENGICRLTTSRFTVQAKV